MGFVSLKELRRLAGFSLLELIIVIVILGIMAVSLSGVIKTSVYGYIDAKDRNRLSQSSKWFIERLSREVREALPQSVRTGNDTGIFCVEFMAIENSSTYLNISPVTTDIINSFEAVGFNLSSSIGAIYVAIMPINPAAVYNVTGTLANIASIANMTGANAGKVLISLSGTPTFSNRSPISRFYLLNNPTSFCLDNNNGKISRYTNYPINAIQAFPPSGGTSSLVAENLLASGLVFDFQPGVLSRSGLLQVSLTAQNRTRNLSGNEESFELFHEVHVRNVP